MIFLQIFFIALGVFTVIVAVLDYFFQPKSSFFILKRVIEYLDESERIKYQKATAIPTAIFGIAIIISGIFFFDNDIFSKIFHGSYVVLLVSMMIINKIHLGYFSPWSVGEKIF